MNEKLKAISDDMLEGVTGGVHTVDGNTMRMEGKANPSCVTNANLKPGTISGGQTLLGGVRMSGGSDSPSNTRDNKRFSGEIQEIKMC